MTVNSYLGSVDEEHKVNILRNHPELLKILLKDQTTGKNIIWATTNKELSGSTFVDNERLIKKPIELAEAQFIKPRIKKMIEEQKERTKGRAEVFTPTWIVKKMVDTVDSEFQELSLTRYVEKMWIEITCGEAPYIVSRYDAVTGKSIPVMERVGFLDKKLQRITREIDDPKKWLRFAKKAYKATYGYEFQGDSLLIARENLLYSFIEYYEYKFNEKPKAKSLKEFANIISFNIFQMDGLKYTIPLTGDVTKVEEPTVEQIALFDFEDEIEEETKEISIGIPVLIKDWKKKKMIEFQSLQEN
ncbi:hypothetical protein JZO70_09905 [Enterococcus sp. 669A]|uniref:Restriction endonuclease n=1 Tax=Candidatus Enterococcus moelleringii TaxID=2815325 RepID=A0ABS3LA34_9ENTE|nr:hypothetical protein [Enterococcus sp. 669A]MBO1306476.1 hypothetical protein [Enterococcus sp. 669A]